jgi:hypothetical protein
MRRLSAIAAAVLASCGGNYPEPNYEIACNEVLCHDADRVDDFQSRDYQFASCTWDCAEYRGEKGVYVVISFGRESGMCWRVESEYVGHGVCGEYAAEVTAVNPHQLQNEGDDQ